jgi:hypothetical protein
MGIFYYIYKRDFSRKYSISIYKILIKIILDKDIKFIAVFQKVFIVK